MRTYVRDDPRAGSDSVLGAATATLVVCFEASCPAVMSPAPAQPRIYHITHVDNLASIARDGMYSDAAMIARGGPKAAIGMSAIKQRRLTLPVTCDAGGFVGEYVPFYFCPRSIMLYLLYRGNHSELTYRGGQGPIVHLELDLLETVAWADANGARWAFSLSNAGARYTAFRCELAQLDEVNWDAVKSTWFTDPEIKEGKQAEFLVYERVPFDLVRSVGVHSAAIKAKAEAEASLVPDGHRPTLAVRPEWYF